MSFFSMSSFEVKTHGNFCIRKMHVALIYQKVREFCSKTQRRRPIEQNANATQRHHRSLHKRNDSLESIETDIIDVYLYGFSCSKC